MASANQTVAKPTRSAVPATSATEVWSVKAASANWNVVQAVINHALRSASVASGSRIRASHPSPSWRSRSRTNTGELSKLNFWRRSALWKHVSEMSARHSWWRKHALIYTDVAEFRCSKKCMEQLGCHGVTWHSKSEKNCHLHKIGRSDQLVKGTSEAFVFCKHCDVWKHNTNLPGGNIKTVRQNDIHWYVCSRGVCACFYSTGHHVQRLHRWL